MICLVYLDITQLSLGISKRDFILFDEADVLPEAAALQSDCEIKAFDLKEMNRTKVTGSRIERDPSLRQNALRHYGKVCMVCGFVPRVDSQLDVHHLNPLADGGERYTGLTDLAVLGANCHRLAHTTTPPIRHPNKNNPISLHVELNNNKVTNLHRQR